MYRSLHFIYYGKFDRKDVKLVKIQVLEETSKKTGKTYYGVFLVNGDFKVLLKFISKYEYESLVK